MENKIELDKIRELTADIMSISIDKISENTHFIKDLGMDSLDIFQLVAELEDAFGIDIPEAAIKNIKTVKDAVELAMREGR
ncbi:MAG: acyl carrier protein [Clostridiales bacterium]|nr:acyl carrier protein [Clostridiales bacterium]